MKRKLLSAGLLLAVLLTALVAPGEFLEQSVAIALAPYIPRDR